MISNEQIQQKPQSNSYCFNPDRKCSKPWKKRNGMFVTHKACAEDIFGLDIRQTKFDLPMER